MDESKPASTTPPQLNWYQRRQVRKLVKAARTLVQKYKAEIESEAEANKKLRESLLALTDILEIEIDDKNMKECGQLINEENIKLFTNDQLEKTLLEALEELEKVI